MNNQKGSAIAWLLIVFVILVFLVAGFLMFFAHPTGTTELNKSEARVESGGIESGRWNLYTNYKHNYQIGYPKDLYTAKYDSISKENINADRFTLHKTDQTDTNALVSVTVYPMLDLSEDVFLKKVYGGALPFAKYIKFRDLKAVQFLSDRSMPEIIVIKEGHVYDILLGDKDVINTFKFTR